jgi:hypothetical protein
VVLNTNQNQPIQARETAVPVGKLKFNRIWKYLINKVYENNTKM